METYPLISCICVTKNGPFLLKRAIRCFEAQTYPNKELIILYQEHNLLTKDFLTSEVCNSLIKVFSVKQSYTLGALRNYAIENSNGDFFCQWDDDDWHNAFRLDFQYNAIKTNSYDACVIDQWIIFDALNERACLSNKRFWEGSLLCSKELFFKKKYGNISRGEDTPFIQYLSYNKFLYLIKGMPNLYIYTYHGGNTFNQDHFYELFAYGKLITLPVTAEINKILKSEYDVLEGSHFLNALLVNEI